MQRRRPRYQLTWPGTVRRCSNRGVLSRCRQQGGCSGFLAVTHLVPHDTSSVPYIKSWFAAATLQCCCICDANLHSSSFSSSEVELHQRVAHLCCSEESYNGCGITHLDIYGWLLAIRSSYRCTCCCLHSTSHLHTLHRRVNASCPTSYTLACRYCGDGGARSTAEGSL